MAAVAVDRSGAIARVWLDRPDRHNALAPDLLKGLSDTFHALAHDDAVRVVVLGGRGKSFCAGADIATMKASADASFEANLTEAEHLAGFFATVADCPKPVVGRLHGNVFGGGVGLTCAVDIAVASSDAQFGLTEVRLGILPAIISPYVIRRLGDRQAREYMLTGERFDAATALRIGLVHHVCEPGDLDRKVDERVAALLAGAPGSQRRIKMVLELFGESTWEEHRSAMPRTLAEVRAGAEAKDGLSAFFEKRKPSWAKD
jgi:methylglutaconyl-CoA hydratase